jgi:hypothetical protein
MRNCTFAVVLKRPFQERVWSSRPTTDCPQENLGDRITNTANQPQFHPPVYILISGKGSGAEHPNHETWDISLPLFWRALWRKEYKSRRTNISRSTEPSANRTLCLQNPLLTNPLLTKPSAHRTLYPPKEAHEAPLTRKIVTPQQTQRLCTAIVQRPQRSKGQY